MKKSSAFLIVILLLCGPTPLSAQTKTIDHGNLSICPGGSVLLEVKNSPENATFQWLKDGNEISGATSNSYSAMQAGSYSVKVTDASLITELYDPVTVVINPSPIAGFTFVTNNQCSSTPIQFTNTSSGNSLTYSWDFSDPTSPNNTSTQQSPSHIFIGSFGSANQSFPVKLTVTSSAGCSTSYTSTITTKQLGDAKLAGQSPITYNGLTYFRACGSGATQMTFVNQSSTSSTNSSYSIDWGDGTTPFSDASLNSTTHTYQVGTWKLTYTVISNNGCSNTAVYYVFVGSNPAVGLGNPGNTVICTGTSLRFPITGTENNPPGTIYTVTFNDGTAPVVYTTAPPYIDHEFQSTSCGKTSGSYSNSFSATIVATNPCSNSSAIVSPIYVSERPKANFTQSKEIVCTSQVVTLANTSQGNDVSDAGCVEGNFVWSISPATGWTKNGDLGNDYGQAIPSLWLNGSKNLSLTFNTPGTYSVSIKNGNSICGSDIITKTICVNASPTAAFSVDNESGCGPLVVKTNNTSSTPTCGSNTFQWSVSPSTGVSYINTTSSSSQNPQFNFSGAGTYTISLTTTSPGSCNSTTSKTITVKAKPSVTLNGIPANLCQGSSITPGATVSSSTPVTYMWTFDGATPANSTTLPAGSITFTGTGNRQITLAATNECGTTSQLSSVLVGATPSITSTNSVSICNNGTVNLALTSNVASTFTWQATSNSNVNGESTSIQTSSTLSNTLANTATTPQTVVYTIIPKATSSGCTGIAQTVNVIVYPTLAPPTVTTPVNYCEGETTTALLATPATGNTLLWYSQGMGGVGSSTTPTVSTASTAPVTYYVSQQSSPANCESGRASITVNVTPKIINNSIGSDQTICSGTPATTIIQSGIAPSGGAGVNTYSYKWESSVDGGNTWNVIAGQIGSSYSPGSPAVKTMYHRIISSGNCSVKSNDVTITVLGSLSHFDIAASQTICAGNTSATLDGQTPNGGNSSFTYLWQSSPDGNTWSDITAATGEDYSPAALNSTTYYKRKTTSGQCSAFSSIIIITVNQKPAATIATNATQICSYNTGTIDFTVSAGKAPFTFALTVTLPDNSISTLTHAANNNSSSLQVLPANSATGKYSYVLTSIKDANGCELSGSTSTADITVKEKPTLTLSSSIAVCSGAGTPLTASGAASYIWTPATGLSTATGSNITATPTATTTYTVTGTTDGCTSSGTITVTVHPKPTPPVTTSNLSYCINATAYPLTATAATGHTLSWYTGTATTGSNTAPTPVTNATATLNYSVSQSNSFLCESDKLPVTVTVYGAITGNTIEQDQTICSGTTAAQIGQQGAPVAGGSGAYTYQWQSSINNGTSWNAMPGQTEASLQPGSPATTTLYQRIISSTSCTSTSNNVTVIVLNQLSHFDISASQIICAGGTPVMLDGQLPIGGTSNFTYLWQSSANGSTWADMTTATGKDYNPGALTVTTYYRRKTTSGQCSALSGPVIITVNPTPVVTITTSTTEICSYNTGAIDFTVSTGKAP
jgi:PKD repeat protein